MTPSLRSGTLGRLLAAGLGPLEARAPALQRTARLGRLAVRVDADEICFALAVAVEEGGATEQLTAEKRHRHDAWPDAIELDVDGRETDRARDALARWVGEEGSLYGEDLLVRLLDALVAPPPERSLYAFIARHGLDRVNDGGVITRVEASDHAVVLLARELALGWRMYELGQVRMMVTVEKRHRKTGAVVDALDQEVYWGRVGTRAYRLPEPDFGSPPLAGWVDAWRAYVTRRLTRLVEEQDGGLPMPMDVLSGRSIFNLAQFWLEEGPLPTAPPPRLRVDAGALDSALARVRAVPLPKMRARLRGRGLPTIHAALELGRHTIVLAAGTASDRVGDDRVLLVSGDEEPVTLLRSDEEIQNRLKYTLDGDADTMRRCLGWLSELLVRSGLDREIVLRDVDGAERITLSAWLAFSGERDTDEPRYDPRLDIDSLVDGHPHWDAHDVHLPPPAEAERIHREHVPRYHAFLREVLDPSFVSSFQRP